MWRLTEFTVALLIQQRSSLESLLASSAHQGALNPAFLATALGVAAFLGAAHALTPGHGKTIVAAYLVGSRGRLLDAVFLGCVVTLTHTASVFLLGLGTLYAARQVALERIYPWLALASGALVTLIGAWLLQQRLKGAHGHPSHSHHHGDGHHHDHPHTLGVESHASPPGKGTLLSLGISGGLVPCPEALVVLMMSISLRRLGLGLLLLVSFSFGLAAVLIGIGCAMVAAQPIVSRFAGERRWLRVLPAVSAGVVTVLGAILVIQALAKL